MSQTTREACSCDRGFQLCPEAVKLWSYVNVAYTEALETGKWFPYHDFLDRYNEHFGVER